MILDILKDTLLDTIKLIPFLFVAFLIIELIEHKMSDKNEKILKKAGRFGPVLGGVLGAIPQCGFSVLASNLYVTRIISLIDKIRPFLISDGGNLEFIKFEYGIVYVSLTGSCAECPMIDVTLKDGIEEMIINEIPEVKEVRNISNN